MATTEKAEHFAWKLQDPTHNNQTYTRPFGLLEQCFYWDIRLEGTADVYQSSLIRVRDGTDPRLVFSRDQVNAAWVFTKHVHPLLGAKIIIDDESDRPPYFMVSEERLRTVSPGEIFFHDVASPAEVQNVVDELITTIPRPMDAGQTACMHILFCTDGSNTVYILSFAAHCIMDGVGNGCLLATFLDAITSDLGRKSVPRLEEQLRVALPVDAVLPVQKLSPARRRWKLSIAAVIGQNRAQNMQGGHPLPRKYTTSTHYTPACSQGMHVDLPIDTSSNVIQSCRRLGVTYGNAFYIILQVALSRLLLRCYRRGDLSHAEWEFRKRQPLITGGPLNMRPFLDKEWFDAGGKSAVCLSIGFMVLKLPFIPLGTAESTTNPSFDDFMSMERFVLRARGVKSQMVQQLKHPLFHEIANSRLLPRSAGNRTLAHKYEKDMRDVGVVAPGVDVPVQEQAANAPVFSCIGSTMGDVTAAHPTQYPLARPQGSKPLLEVDSATVRLHCRPTELYLGAVTNKGRLRFNVYWDGNVYERQVIEEWVDEVRQATIWYLGGGPEQELGLSSGSARDAAKL